MLDFGKARISQTEVGEETQLTLQLTIGATVQIPTLRACGDQVVKHTAVELRYHVWQDVYGEFVPVIRELCGLANQVYPTSPGEHEHTKVVLSKALALCRPPVVESKDTLRLRRLVYLTGELLQELRDGDRLGLSLCDLQQANATARDALCPKS